MQQTNLETTECYCPKTECVRHGNCEACRAFHKGAQPPSLPHCERKPGWWKRLFGVENLSR